jgi:hypothetical protein
MISTVTLAAELGVSHEQAFVAVEQTALGFTQREEVVDGFPVLEVGDSVAQKVRARIRNQQVPVLRSVPEHLRDVSAVELSEWQREGYRLPFLF